MVDVVLQGMLVLHRINKDEGDESLPLLVFRRDVVSAIFMKYSEEDRLFSSHVGIRSIRSIRSMTAKHSSHSLIFFYPRNVTLILHRTTIRSLLLVKEKESPVLAFLNLYVTLHEIPGSL